MTYQPTWIKGRAVSPGERECAERYEILRRFCRQYGRPFTVLDVGANLAYFSLRLTEEFDCAAVAIEGSQAGQACLRVLEQNENPRVIFLARDVTLADLQALAEVEHFDVVLALSVIHHLPGSFEARLGLLRSLGDHLILELAHEQAAGGGAQKASRVPSDARCLGYGASHVEPGARRPILLLSRPKTGLVRSFLGATRENFSIAIASDFSHKTVSWPYKPEARAWHRGINLATYLDLGGAWPTRETIIGYLRSLRLTGAHGDIQPWNVILQGDAVQLIDAADPTMTVRYDDVASMATLIARVQAASGIALERAHA